MCYLSAKGRYLIIEIEIFTLNNKGILQKNDLLIQMDYLCVIDYDLNLSRSLRSFLVGRPVPFSRAAFGS